MKKINRKKDLGVVCNELFTGKFLRAICLLLVVVSLPVKAELLSSKSWRVLDSSKQQLKGIADNNLETSWTSKGSQHTGMAIEIDLGKLASIHRIYMTPGNNKSNFPRSLRISFRREQTDSPLFRAHWDKSPQFAITPPMVEANLVHYREVNLKFNPVIARYVYIEIGPQTAGLPWSIAELELYGTYNKDAFKNKDAVVLPEGAATTLRLAAEDLRYYIGELNNYPIPIIDPQQEKAYPGILYKIVDLKSIAQTPEQIKENRKKGLLPDYVNVERNGREVLFKSWPYKNVFWSACEFLEHQGVRWVYPDPHGDFVPTGKGVDLSILPLKYTPSAERKRFANFSVGSAFKGPLDEGYMFWWRNRYTSTWGNRQRLALGGAEEPVGVKQICIGNYPHSFGVKFGKIVTEEDMKKHPEWYGMFTQKKWEKKIGKEKMGKRLPPSEGGPSIWCMGNPELAKFVVKRLIEQFKDNKNADARINLMPMDYATFCECELCRKWDAPFTDELEAYASGGHNASESYFFFVKNVAEGIKDALPNAKIILLAYNQCAQPPLKIDKFPDNVIVDIVMYGERALPIDSPCNAEIKRRLSIWPKKAKEFQHYSYVLIHTEASDEFKMPVPAVTGMTSRLKALDKIKALNGGTQCFHRSLVYNPWNNYAYPRLLWNINQEPSNILDEFFTGYFQEVKEPMLAYYKTYEDFLIKNNIKLQAVAYNYGPNPGCLTPEIEKKMRGYLKEAQKKARYWVVKERLKKIEEGLGWLRKKLLLELEAQDIGGRPVPKDSDGRYTYQCYKVPSPIKIDGKLDDAAWKDIPEAKGFMDKGAYVIPRQSTVRMGWDAENLYVGIHCYEPNVDKLKPLNGKHKYGVYGEDEVELFFTPKYSKPPVSYYRFAIASNGFLETPRKHRADQWHYKYIDNHNIKTAGFTGKDYWSVEAKIPFAVLGGTPKPDKLWLTAIARVARTDSVEHSSWNKGNWHKYRTHNYLRFIDKVLSIAQAQQVEKKLNREFLETYPEQQKKLEETKALLQRYAKLDNLVKQARLTRGDLWGGCPATDKYPPKITTITWKKPVELNSIVINWTKPSSLYSIEYFDGQSFKLLQKETNNALPVTALSFKTISTNELRICVYDNLNSRDKEIKTIGAYNLK
jgi:hypothetical protein